MAFIIVCSGLFDSEGARIGPILHGFADDYLPGYRDQEFARKIDGIKWIAANHKGAKSDGTIANFEVVSRR